MPLARIGLLAAAVLFTASVALAADESLADLLARARAAALSQGPVAAYAILAAAEDEHIGEIEFDYALGRAALDAGRPDRATLAFARVLAQDPLHAGALIDTGRAYLALGNAAQARATFQTVLALDPPPAIRDQVRALLVQAGEAPGRLALRGYVEANAGWSSNVNQSPTAAQVFVPAFGANFDLAQQNVAKSDSFLGVAGGLDLAAPIDGGRALIGAAEFLQRWHRHETAFDLGAVGLRGGVAFSGEERLTRAQAIAIRSDLGHDPSRETLGVALDHIRGVHSVGALSVFGQAGSYRYPLESLRIYNADFLTVGATLQKFGDGWSALAGVALGGEDDTGGNPQGDKRLVALRAAGEKRLAERLSLAVGAAWQRGRYDAVDPAFLVEREDRRTDFDLLLQYALTASLRLRAGVSWSEQRSNIPIYAFRRDEAWLGLRQEFR
jgi:tetratricopeptide (TPR) repeat protein